MKDNFPENQQKLNAPKAEAPKEDISTPHPKLKNIIKKKKIPKKPEEIKKTERKINPKNAPTLLLKSERDIAMDFATKVYQKFDKIIKSVVHFGSSARKLSTPTSDIDVIILVDDVSVKWDQELIAWYREELGKMVQSNPYQKSLHINTVKLSTWWQDLMRGDPVVINVIRYGDSLIDFGGFFSPLKVLLQEGKIKPTPESIYTLLQRAPTHMARTRFALLEAIDGLYWAMVDSAHAALIAAKVMPPSPEHIPIIMKEQFVDTKLLKMKYVEYYRDLHLLAKEIVHGKVTRVPGKDIDEWIQKTDEFIGVMAKLIDDLIKVK